MPAGKRSRAVAFEYEDWNYKLKTKLRQVGESGPYFHCSIQNSPPHRIKIDGGVIHINPSLAALVCERSGIKGADIPKGWEWVPENRFLRIIKGSATITIERLRTGDPVLSSSSFESRTENDYRVCVFYTKEA